MRRATGVLVLAAILAVTGGSLTSGAAAATPATLPAPRIVATYEWHQAGQLPLAEARRRFRFLRANGIKTVYLEAGDWVDAADQPLTSTSRRRQLEAIRRQLRRYVAAATSFGLAVQATGGGPTWTGDLGYLGELLVKLVGGYNATVAPSERLRGVQLDIEPYVEGGWYDDTQTSLRTYLTTVSGIVRTYRPLLARSANRGLQLGFAVPFWFDGEGDAPGAVAFNGATKPAAHHLIDLLGNLPGAYLVIMSYRNFTGTSDGSIAHAANELWYANKIKARCGLVVGQQYGPVSPDFITFNGYPRRVFRRAAAQITAAFRRYPQFRGVSVDDVDSYLAAGP
jgi:hypothetical protein